MTLFHVLSFRVLFRKLEREETDSQSHGRAESSDVQPAARSKLPTQDARFLADADDGRPTPSTQRDQPMSDFNQARGDCQPPRGNFQQQRGDFQQPRGDFQKSRGNFQQPRGNFQQPRGNFQPPRGDANRARGGFQQARGDTNQQRKDFQQPRGDFNQARQDFQQMRLNDNQARSEARSEATREEDVGYSRPQNSPVASPTKKYEFSSNSSTSGSCSSGSKKAPVVRRRKNHQSVTPPLSSQDARLSDQSTQPPSPQAEEPIPTSPLPNQNYFIDYDLLEGFEWQQLHPCVLRQKITVKTEVKQ